MDLIITHAKCPDGWCAAFIAKKKYPEAEILPLDHSTPVPFDQVIGRDVLVTDFSWPIREDNIKLSKIAKSFRIFDHHKTALESIGDLPFVTFDLKRSGAGLAWDYLFGKDQPASPSTFWLPRPWYVDYVEDRDLWNWKLPNSKAINSYLMAMPMTIQAWSELENITPAQILQLGNAVLLYINHYVQEAVKDVQRGVWTRLPNAKTYSVAVLNVPYMNCSEIGNVLAVDADVSLTWFERADGNIQFSLRSIGDIDVSEIAKVYQGGGHKNAAGFRLSVNKGRNLIDILLGRAILEEWEP